MKFFVTACVVLSAIPGSADETGAVHGLAEVQYQRAAADFSVRGYRPVGVNVYPTAEGNRYAGIWINRSKPESVSTHGLTALQYQREFDRRVAAGYRLVGVSGCEVRGGESYSAVWTKNEGAEWSSQHGLSEAAFRTAFDRMTKQGYRLVFVDGFVVGDRDRYSVIWEKHSGVEWKARHRLTSDEYQKAVNEYVAAGYRLTHVSGYTVGSTDYYAAIWQKKSGPIWRAHHRLTHDRYQQLFDRYRAEGYRVTQVDGYQIDGKPRYAAIWEENQTRLSAVWATADSVISTGRTAPQLKPLDQLMTSFLHEHNIPGGALAVIRDGQLVYSRGFGYSDIERKSPVTPNSLFRIASISKPVTAVAIMQLAERRKLKLDDPVLRYVQFKPHIEPGSKVDSRWNDVTIRHLLHHTGGWDRKASFDPMFRSVEFARLLRVPPPAGPEHVIRVMLGKPLDFDPGSKYVYSNFGYCLLGRVIESVSGQSYEEFVRESVLKPLKVTTMRIGATLPRGRFPSEVSYYDTSGGPSVFAENVGKRVPQPYGAWHLEAMDSHGGWIASAVDLVSFASAFDDIERCRILKPVSIREMFARPSGPAGFESDGRQKARYYACGWSVRPLSGGLNTWHMGGLPGTSTILVRRLDGFTWAVLFNSWRGKDGQLPSVLIDGPMHQAVDAVRSWPPN